MSGQLGLFSGIPRDAIGYMDELAPTVNTFVRVNQPRLGLYDSVSDSNSVALTTQVMTAVPIKLGPGDVVTNISFQSGTTAAGTPTNWWFALYDTAATPALLFQSADQLTAAWAAFTVKTLALSTAYTVARAGIYWAAIMVKATTVPTLLGSLGVKPIATGERNLAVTSGAALTTTATATLASPTVANFVPFVALT